MRFCSSLMNKRKGWIPIAILLCRTVGAISAQDGSSTDGVEFVLAVNADTNASPERRGAMRRDAKEIISDRLSETGLRFSLKENANDQLIVRVSKVANDLRARIRDDVTVWGPLQFCLVHPHGSKKSSNEPPPSGYDEMFLEYADRHGTSRDRLFVKRDPELTGTIIAKALYEKNSTGRFHILLELTTGGSHQFHELTRRIVQSSQNTAASGRLAIVVKDRLVAAPMINQEIAGGRLMISGEFTEREALELCNMLNSPMDFSVRILAEREF